MIILFFFNYFILFSFVQIISFAIFWSFFHTNSLWNFLIFQDFIGWSYLILLGWEKRNLYTWLFPFIVFKESVLLFFLIITKLNIYYLIIIIFSGLGSGMLLSLGIGKQYNWKNNLIFYSIVSFLGKLGLFLLENYVLIIYYNSFFSYNIFIFISFFSFISFFISLQNYKYFILFRFNSFWIISFWTLDFYIFSLGSSGLTSVIYFSFILFNFYIINLELFISSYIGIFYSIFVWGKIIILIHTFLHSLITGIIFSIFSFIFIKKSRLITF